MRTKSFSDSVTPFLTKRKKSACAKAQTEVFYIISYYLSRC